MTYIGTRRNGETVTRGRAEWGDGEVGGVGKDIHTETGKGKRQTHGNGEAEIRRKGKTGRVLLSDIIGMW